MLSAAPAVALVVVSDKGSAKAPRDDPGWGNVGSVWALSGIYLGGGWMLTASHVSAGPAVLAGRRYEPVANSAVPLQNPDGSPVDLVLFRIQGAPRLPKLRIATATPEVGASVVMIACGRTRGAPTSWSGHDGFAWAAGAAPRWGVSEVFKTGIHANGTDAFATQFRKEGGEPNEAQAALGDSGGAAFVKLDGKWLLAGLLFGVAGFERQPADIALFGNLTLVADLSRYRAQIEKITAAPPPQAPPKPRKTR
jgi:hypothetical protein